MINDSYKIIWKLFHKHKKDKSTMRLQNNKTLHQAMP